MACKSSLISTYPIIMHEREQWNAETSYILRDIIYVYSITYYVVSLYLGHSCAIIAPFSLLGISTNLLVSCKISSRRPRDNCNFLTDAMEISFLFFFFLNKNNRSSLEIGSMKSKVELRGIIWSNIKLSTKIVNV